MQHLVSNAHIFGCRVYQETEFYPGRVDGQLYTAALPHQKTRCREKTSGPFDPGLIKMAVNGGARLVIVLMNMQRVTGMGYIAFVFMDMGVVP